MSKCAGCGATIVMGGVSEYDQRFCREACVDRWAQSAIVTDDDIAAVAQELFHGRCPDCNGAGPVEVHSSYRIVSFVVFVRRSTIRDVCCGKCGARHALRGMLICGLLGWWSLPFGLLFTPAYLIANAIELFRRKPRAPSKLLLQFVRRRLGIRAKQGLPTRTGAAASDAQKWRVTPDAAER